ncbi:MAG: putative family peptidase [Phycisphaerales bacterium]|nr:putative family peptidase [Phycisphaerales bacterium]
MLASPKPARRFVPADFDPAEWSQIEPLAQQLQDRAINSPDELVNWLLDMSELSGVVDEYSCRRYIDKSCHTDDAEIKKRYFHFVEEIEPKLKPVFFELQKRFLESPHHEKLTDPRYAMLTKKWQADVDVFRPANIPIETQITKLVTEYDEISGAMMVDFRGSHITLSQLGRFQEEPDRDTRKEAFETGLKRRMEDREKIDDLFDQLLPLRKQIAENAGFPDYRAYTWKVLKRFDYTPEDCTKFADAIEKSIVPLVRELDQKRKADLGIDVLRPWDLAVDPKNRKPLHPFDPKDIEGFVNTTKQLFERLSPALAAEFETLRTHGNLDLDSRKGKQPGGYQISLDESKQPFIFMNAAGSQRDVETLIHEGGHAFHFIAAANAEPLTFLRAAPMEFCEVASMAMEALSSEHFDLFYKSEEDAQRAKQSYLEGVIRFFPWMAIIDQFQHWLYTHPGHTRDERKATWLGLLDRFGGSTSWEGYEAGRESSWQRQLHLFHVPFYYVEYGIAQLGAMQMWLKAKQDPRQALANYRAALKLGGTKPLPDLFSAAGLKFDFTPRTIDPLIRAVHDDLLSHG